jgi:hypothetical protein
LKIDKRIAENKPEFSYTANAIIESYNVIQKARNYSNSAPLPISTDQIISYLQLNDCPIEVDVFCDCIFMIDQDFIDSFSKQITQLRKAAK